MAQSVKRLTLDLGSCRDLTVVTERYMGISANSMELAWNSPSPSLSAAPLCTCAYSLSLRINKLKNKQINK